MRDDETGRSFVVPTAASTVTLLVIALPPFLLGAFAPTIKDELGFDDAALGLIFTLGYLVSALVLPFGGALADRSGPRTAIRLALGFAVVGSLTMYGLADAYVVVVVAFACSRVAEAIAQPATNTLVGQGVSVRRRGTAMGIKQAAIPLATMLAGLAVPALGASLGWRGVFGLVAVAAVPLALGLPNVAAPARQARGRARALWSTPHLRMAALAGAFAAASIVSVPGFLTSAAEEAGFSERDAGLLLSLGGAVMVIARVSWGFVADRFAFDRFQIVGAMLGTGSFGFLLFTTENRPAMVVGTLVLFGIGWSWPGLLLLGVLEQHGEAPGAATAVMQTGIRVGAMVSPLTFGVIVDRFGYAVAWYLPFATAVVGSILLFRTASLVRRRSQLA